MPLPALPPQRFAEIDQVLRRFMAANAIGIVVGLVLVPLLFGGIALGLFFAIPAPFGAYVGGSIGGAGALVLLFLLWYRHRAKSKAPFAAWAQVLAWHVLESDGSRSYSVEVLIEQACPVTAGGYHGELVERRGQQKRLVLTSHRLYQVVAPGQAALLLCMPTGEVVAIDLGGQLVTA